MYLILILGNWVRTNSFVQFAWFARRGDSMRERRARGIVSRAVILIARPRVRARARAARQTDAIGSRRRSTALPRLARVRQYRAAGTPRTDITRFPSLRLCHRAITSALSVLSPTRPRLGCSRSAFQAATIDPTDLGTTGPSWANSACCRLSQPAMNQCTEGFRTRTATTGSRRRGTRQLRPAPITQDAEPCRRWLISLSSRRDRRSWSHAVFSPRARGRAALHVLARQLFGVN